MSSRARNIKRGKGRSKETDWAEWTWDGDSCWVTTRINEHGVYEERRSYPDRKNDPASTPRTAAVSNPYQKHENSGGFIAGRNDDNTYGEGAGAGYAAQSSGLDSPNPGTNSVDYGSVSLSDRLASVRISSSNQNDPVLLRSNHIIANDPKRDSERLDPRYCVIKRPDRFFKVGRVFAVLWSEPAGKSNDDSYHSDEESYKSKVRFGEMVHTKIRRFVVVREQKGHSTCLSLSTYNGRGVTKPGVNQSEHVAVYPSGGKVKLIGGEFMDKAPLPIIIEDVSQRLDPLTRMNCSKVYTVEHNVKALKIGRVPDEYLSNLRKYFVEGIAGPDLVPYVSDTETEYTKYSVASAPVSTSQLLNRNTASYGQSPFQNQLQNYPASTIGTNTWADHQSYTTPTMEPGQHSIAVNGQSSALIPNTVTGSNYTQPTSETPQLPFVPPISETIQDDDVDNNEDGIYSQPEANSWSAASRKSLTDGRNETYSSSSNAYGQNGNRSSRYGAYGREDNYYGKERRERYY